MDPSHAVTPELFCYTEVIDITTALRGCYGGEIMKQGKRAAKIKEVRQAVIV